MVRAAGTPNIKPFESRDNIATTSLESIRHLARQGDLTPLAQFEALLRNQRNYLSWIDSRHEELLEAKQALNPTGRGPKDAVYKKYRWYAEQQSLLEAVNGFEVFYKSSLIALAKSIRRYVPAQKIKGNVEAKTLWAARGSASFVSLIFESQLYHNLDTVDEALNMLIGCRRYQTTNLKGKLQKRVRAIHCAFQVRHTLSHNQGKVTQSDRAKFIGLGFDISHTEVIDPNKDSLGVALRDALLSEVHEFTVWLLDKTAEFLSDLNRNGGVMLDMKVKQKIESNLGMHPALSALPWV